MWMEWPSFLLRKATQGEKTKQTKKREFCGSSKELCGSRKESSGSSKALCVCFRSPSAVCPSHVAGRLAAALCLAGPRFTSPNSEGIKN